MCSYINYIVTYSLYEYINIEILYKSINVYINICYLFQFTLLFI